MTDGSTASSPIDGAKAPLERSVPKHPTTRAKAPPQRTPKGAASRTPQACDEAGITSPLTTARNATRAGQSLIAAAIACNAQLGTGTANAEQVSQHEPSTQAKLFQARAQSFSNKQASTLAASLATQPVRPRQRSQPTFSRLRALSFDDEDDSLSLTPQQLDAATQHQTLDVSQILKRLANIEQLLESAPAPRNAKLGSSMPLDYQAGDSLHLLHRPKRKFSQYDEKIEHALDCATADRHRGRNSTGVKAWFAFCQDVEGVQPERPMDPNQPLWVRLEEEWLSMRFICALVEERGVLPETASKYFSQVQGWHAREFGVKLAGGLKLERLPQMVKGLRRANPRQPKAIRRGISPEQLGRAHRQCLNPSSPLHANLRAATSVALQGLLRSAEYCGAQSAETLTRGDIRTLDDQQLTIMMHPCKNMRHIAGKTCPLVIGAGGTHVDAVAEVRNLLRVDPAPDDAPLFRDPSTNKPLTYHYMLTVVHQLVSSIGLNPAEYGTHSLRIGGASALFAAGANDTVIRTMGRWSSDIHRLYVRACYEQCLDWTRRCGSASSTSIAADIDEVDDY